MTTDKPTERPDINKMGRGSGERIPVYLEIYGVTDADYGNSFRYEAAVLHHHWEVDHKGKPMDEDGQGGRVYTCEMCRTQSNRVGVAIREAAESHGADPKTMDGWSGTGFTYAAVVERVSRAIPEFIKDAARRGVAKEQAKIGVKADGEVGKTPTLPTTPPTPPEPQS